MRTTMTSDDRLAAEPKRLAVATGKPFKAVLNETSRAGLCIRKTPSTVQRLRPVSRGLPQVGLDLEFDRQ